MPATQTAQTLAPGSRFSIPPFTDEVEQPENNDGLTATVNSSSQTTVQGIIPFMQSDVIYCWLLYTTIVETVTATGTITQSMYYPEIYYGPIQLNMQYQYPAIDVASGIDLAYVNQLRPFRRRSYNNMRGLGEKLSAYTSYGSSYPFVTGVKTTLAGGIGFGTTPYLAPYAPNASGVQQTRKFVLELPTCVWFDEYYDLDEQGNPLSGPHSGYISPANMGGYARVVTPSLKLNQAFTSGGTNLPDQAPYTITGGGATYAGTATFNIQRVGVLGNVDSSVLPQPTNWQYNIAHLRYNVGAVTKFTIPINSIFAGQIMSIIVRLFDASTELEINLSTITSFLLRYGGSVTRLNLTPYTWQKKFYDVHNYIPGEGVIILDLATDITGHVSNSYLLNTLRTASVNLDFILGSAPSSQAYAEVTIEGLRWVPLPVQAGQ